jgi:adenylate cyclase class 2
MAVEIETKLRVESLDPVSRRLSQVGAVLIDETVHFDRYFDDGGRTLTRADSCVRLRRQTGRSGRKILLTYKGPRRAGSMKTRLEIETAVLDEDSAAAFLSALGLKQQLAFEKRRGLWRVGECTAALDELPLLGSFVEIEGPDEASIAAVQGMLGLGGSSHVAESYASLVEAAGPADGDADEA